MKGIPQGSIVLTPQMADLLLRLLPVTEKRRTLSKDTFGWKLLYEITECAYTPPIAANGDNGNDQRQLAASAEELNQTVVQVSQRANVSPRTVRHHIEKGILTASREGRNWQIPKDEADKYVAQHRRP